MTDPIEDSVRGLQSAYEVGDRVSSVPMSDGKLVAAAILLVGSEIIDLLQGIERALWHTSDVQASKIEEEES